MRIKLLILGTLTALSALGGCASLHNAADDKAAQTAVSAFQDAGLGKALEAERIALTKSQAERQQLVTRSQLALRDATLALFLDAAKPETAWGALRTMTQERINTIAGDVNVQVARSCRTLMPGPAPDALALLKSANTFSNQLAVARRNLDFAVVNANQGISQINIRLAKLGEPAAPACAAKRWVLPDHLQSDLLLKRLADDNAGFCDTVDIAAKCIADLSTGSGGLLFKAGQDLTDIATAKAEIAAATSKKRKIYVDLLAEAEAAVAVPGAAERFAGKLKAALDDMANVKSTTSSSVQSSPILSRLSETGRLTALVEKQTLLEEYIAALSGKPSETATGKQHRVFLVSELVNRATSQSAPPTAGVLMEAEFNRQQIAAASVRIERAAEAERLIKSQRDSLLDELAFLLDAQAHLADAPSSCTGKPLYAGLSSGAANPCSMHAAKALLSFSAAWTAGRIPVEQAEYLRIDQLELAALDESEAALTQTETVLKAALAQIGLLHAGGIKPEELAALVQALSLPAIAIRMK